MAVSVHESTLASGISRVLLALIGVGVFACGGEISIVDQATGAGPALGSPSAAAGVPPGTPGSFTPQPGGPETEFPTPSTRAARLTHVQWENSVRDLFHLDGDTAFSQLLRSDPVQSGFLFDNNALAMSVDDALWSGYQRAAEQIAEFVTTDPTRANRWMPASPAGATDPDARARALIDSLGLRAHRRPLESQEAAEYLALFRMGGGFYSGMGNFEAGARLVVEAMLQSPYFTYRVEPSMAPQGGMIALSGYEVASRLSFTLWNSMPDDALFESARANRLTDRAEVLAQANRMLADPRAQAVVEHFHDQLFEVARFANIKPAPGVFTDLPPTFAADVATAQRRFVRETLFAGRGSYEALLTSTETFANGALAKIYGVPGAESFGAEFRKITLDPAQRRGIFTQIGFLALNATPINPDPIHRGVFLAKRFTCTTIAAPPAKVPPLPEPMGRTNREVVEAHTQDPNTVCASCHATVINPLGFPFESFDAIGRFRTTDNGHPVVTSSDPLIGDMRVHVDGALQLATALANSEAAHRCYAQHWLEFAYGRPSTMADGGMIAKLAKLSRDQREPVVGLIADLVTSQAFLSRSVQELP